MILNNLCMTPVKDSCFIEAQWKLCLLGVSGVLWGKSANTSYHNVRIYNIHTYCLCHGTLFVQPVYRLDLVGREGAYIW